RDHHRVTTGVQLGQRLVLRDPAAEDVVGQHLLAPQVVDLDADVLAEAGQRYGRIALEVVHLVGPFLERRVLANTGLQGDRVIFRLARDLVRTTGVAALIPGGDLGGPLEG